MIADEVGGDLGLFLSVDGPLGVVGLVWSIVTAGMPPRAAGRSVMGRPPSFSLSPGGGRIRDSVAPCLHGVPFVGEDGGV